MRRVVLAALVAAAAAAAVLTTQVADDDPTPPSPATAGLATLTVAVEDTGAHYRRADWGGWTQHGACTTRETILAEQGTGETVDGQCRPVCAAVCWTSPYDGVTTGDPGTLQIDHVVPLAEAARSGARDWTAAARRRYYNDPVNLVAVTARSNNAKSDQDPAGWRPAVRDWCVYATAWITVKVKYSLTVDAGERDALTAMLRGCP